MRVRSGSTTTYLYFIAIDSADNFSRKTGLSSFTVVRSRNGAADVTYTTPTITEIDATTMPGVYALLLDEDTTVASGADSEEMALHITATGMVPVTRVVELFRREVTSGETLTVSSGSLAAIADGIISPDTYDGWSSPMLRHSAYISGAVFAGTSVTLTGGSATDERYTGTYLTIPFNGTDHQQNRRILSYNGTTKVAVIDRAFDIANGTYDALIWSFPPAATANENADALLDRSNGIETGWTLRQVMKLFGAVLLGKLSGAGTATEVFRDIGDTKDRVTATVDASGNRTAVTKDAT